MKRFHYAWMIMISCCAIMLISFGVLFSCVGIFLRPISEDLDVSMGAISMHMTIRMLAGVFVLPFAEKLLTRGNFRLVLSVAFAGQLIIFGAMSTFNALWQFYIAGALMGIFSAFVNYFPVPMLIYAWFGKKSGTAMGLSMAFSGIGGAIFAPIGSAIIAAGNWRSGFIVLAVIGAVIALPFTIFIVRRDPSEMGMTPYGAEESDSPKQAEKPAGTISAGDMLRNPVFYLLALFISALFMNSGIIPQIPSFTEAAGFSIAFGATANSLAMIGITASKLISGTISDKFGVMRMVIFVIFWGVLGCLILIFFGAFGAGVLLGTFLLGFGAGLSSVAAPLATVALFGGENFSRVYSYVAMFATFIGAFAVTIFGAIYDVTGYYSAGFLLNAITLSLGVTAFIVAMRRPVRVAASRL